MNEIENKKIIISLVLSERAGPYMDPGREQGEIDLISFYSEYLTKVHIFFMFLNVN